MNNLKSVVTWLAWLAVLFALPGCGSAGPEQAASPPTGEDQMKQILAEIASSTPREHPYLGTGKLDNAIMPILKAEQFNDPLPVNYTTWAALRGAGKAEIRLGMLEKGIAHLQKAYAMAAEIDFNSIRNKTANGLPRSVDLNVVYTNRIRFDLGVAYLRFGETQNCCASNNQQSCILPIQGAGVHTKAEGSTQAIRYFTEILESPAPGDADAQLNTVEAARWLLNIAYMTLGRWPADVPASYRLSEDQFTSPVDFPRFTNVLPAMGHETFNLCGGAVVDDFDGDGYLDIVTSTWDTQGAMKFFHNNADGSFDDRSAASRLSGFTGGLNMVHGDYDNDGDLDIFVLRGAWLQDYGRHPNSLLQNNGKGVFTDVTFQAGLGKVHAPSKTAALADYDLDGDLDIFVGNESTRKMQAPNQLFRNNGDGTFTDVATQAGLGELLFCMGAVWGDYNNDRWPDLYVSTGFSNPHDALAGGGPNRLYRNNGDGSFTDVAETLDVTRPLAGFPAWFWDFNNDGNLDIYASCSSGPVGVLVSNTRFGLNCLYQGDGGTSFSNVAAEVKLDYPAQPMGANFGDLNGDGFPDFYLATGNIQYSELRPNVMFLNSGGVKFENVTYAGGFGHLQKGHGVVFADIDNDGDQDVYVQLGGAWPGDKSHDALFENPGFKTSFLTLQLEGVTSNRSAIGARIKVEVIEGGKPRTIYQWVNSGGSFGGNPLRKNIGLGAASSINRVEVFWPRTGKTQEVTGAEINGSFRITEGQPEAAPLKLKTFKLGK